MNNENTNLWKEIKKLGSDSKFTPCYNDDRSGDSNITSLFAGKFSQLYNSVGYTQTELDDVVKSINDCLEDKCENNYFSCSLSTATIEYSSPSVCLCVCLCTR